MRLSLTLLLCLFLAACPSPKSADSQTISSTPSPTPEVTATASPAASNPTTTDEIDFLGVWTTTDEQGQLFDIAVFPNGQVVTNWTKSRAGAYGQRGLWRRLGDQMVIFFQDGTSSRLEKLSDGFRWAKFDAKAPDGPAIHSVAARLLSPEESKFIGVWRLNREPDGTYQYLALQSDGRAFSSVNNGTEGKWITSNGAAECTWPDGWVDRIETTPEGWQKRSTIGQSTGDPADLSQATRVGESTFEIAP